MAGKQGKSSKMGRNSTFCAAYKAKGQRESHMRNHPGDEKTYQRFESFYSKPHIELTMKGIRRDPRNASPHNS